MTDPTLFERLTELDIKNDLGMYYCGKRINTPNHSYGPEIRSHYLLVLVNKGKARMLSGNKQTFGEHDLLVMQPGERIHYKALEDWSISWLGLYGETVSRYLSMLGVDQKNPIIHVPLYSELKAVMDKIYELSQDRSINASLSMTGLIYEFFAVLFKGSEREYKTDTVAAALKILDYNYYTDISLEKLARLLCVTPAYFSRLFYEKMHITPKRYVLNKRIERAKELLSTTDASICEISNSVGYEDQFYFCRIFKKYSNMSPSEYRKKA